MNLFKAMKWSHVSIRGRGRMLGVETPKRTTRSEKKIEKKREKKYLMNRFKAMKSKRLLEEHLFPVKIYSKL